MRRSTFSRTQSAWRMLLWILSFAASALVIGCTYVTDTSGVPLKITATATNAGSQSRSVEVTPAIAAVPPNSDTQVIQPTESPGVIVSATATGNPPSPTPPADITVSPVIAPVITISPADHQPTREAIESILRKSARRISIEAEKQIRETAETARESIRAMRPVESKTCIPANPDVGLRKYDKSEAPQCHALAGRQWDWAIATTSVIIASLLALFPFFGLLKKQTVEGFRFVIPLPKSLNNRHIAFLCVLCALAIVAAFNELWWLGLFTAAAATVWMGCMICVVAHYGDMEGEFKSTQPPLRVMPEQAELIWGTLPGRLTCVFLGALLIAINVLSFAALWMRLGGTFNISDALYISFENGIAFSPPEPTYTGNVAGKWLVVGQHINSVLLVIWALPIIGSRLADYEGPPEKWRKQECCSISEESGDSAK